MQNYEEQIRFVMQFVQTPLEELKPGATKDFEREVVAFAGVPRSLFAVDLVTDLPPLQRKVEQELRLFATRNVRESKGSEESPTVRFFPSGEGLLHGLRWQYKDGQFAPRLPPESIQLTVDASSFPAHFLWNVYVALSKVDVRKIRACSRCTRLFFADHGNQWFCSARCANKARAERFRESVAMQRADISEP